MNHDLLNNIQRSTYASAISGLHHAPKIPLTYTSSPPKKAEFAPAVKPCDKSRRELEKHKIIDPSNAEVGKSLVNIQCPKLDDTQKLKLLSSLSDEIFKIFNHGIDFNVVSTPYDFLLSVLSLCANGVESNNSNIIKILFSGLEIAGSGALKICGTKFLRAVIQELLTQKLPKEQHPHIPEILDIIFSTEAVKQLERKLNKKLADLDIRIILPDVPKTEHQNVIQSIINAYIEILYREVKKFDEAKKIACVELIHKLAPHTKAWLHKDLPNFEKYAIQYLGFNKYIPPVLDENNRFHIEGFGHPDKLVLEIITIFSMARKEMFPAIRLPFINQFDKKKGDIVPVGDHSIQCVVDTVCGLVRPMIHDEKTKDFIEESDLKMLLCRYARGEVSPVVGGEEYLVKVALKLSKEKTNKTTKKIVTEKPELACKLDQIFPDYIVYLLKDVVDNHLGKTPQAALVLTINALRVFRHHLGNNELEYIIKEMSELWEDKFQKNSLLQSLSELLNDKSVSVNKRLSLLKLLAFLYCQASTPESFNIDELNIYPRSNESKPCFEIAIPNGEYPLSILVDGSEMQETIKHAIEYLKHKKTNTQKAAVEKIIAELLPKTLYLGRKKSPLFEDISHFNINPMSLVDVANEFITNKLLNHQNLGFYLLFAAQTLIETHLDCNKLLPHMHALSRSEILTQPILQNLSYLIPKEITIELQRLNSVKDDFTFYKEYILCLSNIGKYGHVAYTLWKYVLSHHTFDRESFHHFALTFIQYLRFHTPALVINVLSECSSMRIFTLFDQMEILEKYLNKWDFIHIQYAPLIQTVIAETYRLISKEGSVVEKHRFIKLVLSIPENYRSKEIESILEALQPKTVVIALKCVREEKKPEDILADKLFQLRTLIQKFPEQSIASLKSALIDNSIPLSDKKQLVTLNLERLMEKNNYSLAYKLILYVESHHPLQEEGVMIKYFVETCVSEINNIEDVDSVLSIFEKYLKYHTISPNIDYFIYGVNIEKILNLFDVDFERDHPLTAKLIKSCLPKVLMTLYENKNHDLYLRLFKKVSTWNISFFTEHINNFIPLLTKVIDLPFIKSHSDYLQLFVQICEKYVNHLKLPDYIKLLKELSDNAHGIKSLYYLNRLATVKTFTSNEDLSFLLLQFQKHMRRKNLQWAMHVLKLYNGKRVAFKNIDNSQEYFSVLSKSFIESKWTTYLSILSVCPFLIDEEMRTKVRDNALEIIKKVLESADILPTEFFFTLFNLINSLDIVDQDIWCLLYQKGIATKDATVCEKIGNHFESNCKNINSFDAITKEKLFKCCLNGLRYCPPKVIYKTLSSDSTLLELIKKYYVNPDYSSLYNMVWDSWEIIFRGKSGIKTEDVISKVKAKHAEWINAINEASRLHHQLRYIKLLLNVSETTHIREIMLSIDSIIELKKKHSNLTLPEPEWKEILISVVKALVKLPDLSEYGIIIPKIGEECINFKVESMICLKLVPYCVDINSELGCYTGLQIVNKALCDVKEAKIPIADIKILSTFRVNELIGLSLTEECVTVENLTVCSKLICDARICLMISKKALECKLPEVLRTIKSAALGINDIGLARCFLNVYYHAYKIISLEDRTFYNTANELYIDLNVYFTLHNSVNLVDIGEIVSQYTEKLFSNNMINPMVIENVCFEYVTKAINHLRAYEPKKCSTSDKRLVRLATLIDSLIEETIPYYGYLTTKQLDTITEWAFTLKMANISICSKLFESLYKKCKNNTLLSLPKIELEFKCIRWISDYKIRKGYIEPLTISENESQIPAIKHIFACIFNAASALESYEMYDLALTSMMQLLPQLITKHAHNIYEVVTTVCQAHTHPNVKDPFTIIYRYIEIVFYVLENMPEYPIQYENLIKPLIMSITKMNMTEKQHIVLISHLITKLNAFNKDKNLKCVSWENIYVMVLIALREILGFMNIKYDELQRLAEIKKALYPLIYTLSKQFLYAFTVVPHKDNWQRLVDFYVSITKDYLCMKMIESEGKYDQTDEEVIFGLFKIFDYIQKDYVNYSTKTTEVLDSLISHLKNAQDEKNVFTGLAEELAKTAVEKKYYTSFPYHLFKKVPRIRNKQNGR
jgi:hypothetical protein